MNILSVATTYPRYSGDTERAFVHDLNRSLVSRGHGVTALVPHAPGAADSEELDGVKVVRFRYAPENFERIFYGGGALPNLRASWRAKAALPSALIKMRMAIGKNLRRVKPDILHVHWLIPQGYFALAPARAQNVPLAVTVHGADIHQMARGKLRMFARQVITKAGAITANTEDTARAVSAIADAKKLEVIPMGLDLSLFSPQRRDNSLRGKFQIRGPWILSVGRLVEKKGLIYLIRALPEILKKFPDAKLTIAGDGPERTALESESKSLKIAANVHFIGPAGREEVAALMASADIFAGPSIVDSRGDTEAQGVVFVEAMASGCPVVATTVGGIPDVMTSGENGLLVEPENPGAVANALLRIIQDKNLAQKLIIAGFSRAQAYGWPSIAEKFELTFRELLRP